MSSADQYQDNEEWKVVSAHDKKRVMRKRGVRRRLPMQSADGDTTENNNALKSVAMIDNCVKECIQYLCEREDGFWRRTVGLLRETFHADIDEIICLGIGNFSKSSPTSFDAALWQVSFILQLQSELKCMNISFYDPISLPIENDYLRQQPNCTVFETNLQGRHKSTGQALFFLPHCPRQLYENVISEHWGTTNKNLCIIGNSLELLVESCKFMHCTKKLLPYCVEHALHIDKEEMQRAPGNLEGAFNDTYLCCIGSVPWEELEKPSCSSGFENDTLDCELL